ncbi:response regulator transcription factor [Dinoroseobacter sp. PD6]|uniref:response regulator transcription factor n=1 Tax=Dinoroseobacter sp. PD6 TaxID=3028384 RepID=UPI0030843C30
MPGINGIAFQDRIAATSKSCPVVFLTGRGDIAMGVRAMESGAFDFLTKPVESERLLTRSATQSTMHATRNPRCR